MGEFPLLFLYLDQVGHPMEFRVRSVRSVRSRETEPKRRLRRCRADRRRRIVPPEDGLESSLPQFVRTVEHARIGDLALIVHRQVERDVSLDALLDGAPRIL